MNLKTIIILCVIGLAFLLPSASAAYGYYTIPIQALTNSPGDSDRNYIGNTPVAPTINVTGNNRVYIPTTGVIERVEIYDYSGTAGTAEAYTYYIQINGDITKNYLIQAKSVAASERIFTNSSMGVAVTAGDWFEINRTHPVWATNPLTNTVGGYVAINATTEPGYVLPYQQASSSPADTVSNYHGYFPLAMNTAPLIYAHKAPAGGNITKTYVVDNSSTVIGTAEAIVYYVSSEGGSTNLVQSVASLVDKMRIFSNTAMSVNVSPGDRVDLIRKNPAWATNPTGNVVGGLAFVNTALEPTTIAKGYPIYVQTISATPADTTAFYFGQNPVAITTTAATRKVYIPKSGTINKVYIEFYATTLSTNENLALYVRKNNAADTLIAIRGSQGNYRAFENNTMGLSVVAGDYIEIKGIPPAWVTNPAGTFSGYVYVNYTAATGGGGGGDIILPPVSDFSANITSTGSPAVIQFFDQSNNTIPGTTTYNWNFTDGGTKVDSTDINPTFTYGTPGTYTINHTIVSSGTVSTKSKTITISGSAATAPPNASFKIVLTDTSTNVPTSWKWNATNLLGNNTEVTFSTTQHPIMNFGTGNWRINLTVTNAFGSNTTNQTIGWNLSSPRVYFWNRTA